MIIARMWKIHIYSSRIMSVYHRTIDFTDTYTQKHVHTHTYIHTHTIFLGGWGGGGGGGFTGREANLR